MGKTEKKLDMRQGHWILARLGKRVLRPGGLELTGNMIDSLHISPDDDVVEFAPGLGVTARRTCSLRPRSYTAVEINEEAAGIMRRRVKYDRMKVVVADAMDSTLPAACADKVYCEAMLTMQNRKNKEAVIREAVRILRPGGYYAIHEICLVPEDISDGLKRAVYRDMAAAIQVDARPVTIGEWGGLFEEAGLELVGYATNAMHLLEPRRVIADEGLPRTAKIAWNLLTHPALRKRVLEMRRVFRRYDDNLRAITILVRKKDENEGEKKDENGSEEKR